MLIIFSPQHQIHYLQEGLLTTNLHLIAPLKPGRLVSVQVWPDLPAQGRVSEVSLPKFRLDDAALYHRHRRVRLGALISCDDHVVARSSPPSSNAARCSAPAGGRGLIFLSDARRPDAIRAAQL